MSKQEEVIDQALKMREQLRDEIAAKDEQLKKLESTIDRMAGSFEKTNGTVKLTGGSYCATIVRKENVKYTDKKRLAELVATTALRDLYRVDVRESGRKVAKWLDETADEILKSEVLAIREVTAGKPRIDIAPIKTGKEKVPEDAQS